MTDSRGEDPALVAADAPEEESAAEPAGEPSADADSKPDMDEVKRKFREALDAKRQAHSESSEAGGRDTGRIHGARGPAGGKRSFRRKSG